MTLFSILLQNDKSFAIAEEHGVQTLILGAWGCGVFEWNPEIVAELFMEIKGKYYIRRSWVI